MATRKSAPDDLSGTRVTLMGLGRFGGGLGAARWLVSQGADVRITDMAGEEALAGPLEQLRDLIDAGAVSLRLGGHNVADFTDTDLVVANPAVPKPWENRFLRAAEAAGVKITTEIRLLVERLPSRDRTIGVTGTAGKSTTTAMIAHILKKSLPEREPDARVWLGGNIGGSLLASLDEMTERDWVVLELSSAMLHWLNRDVGWSPATAVVTNLAPNHLDWHGTVEHYVSAKHAILARRAPSDSAVLPATLREWGVAGDQIIDDSVRDDIELSVPGEHNQWNAQFALAAASLALGVQVHPELLADFPGLPHRLQLVAGDRDAVRFVNDSKCTTPEAAILAVEAFEEDAKAAGRPIVRLIAGGYDKKIDLGSLERIAPRLAGAYTIGATGPVIAKRLAKCGSTPRECGTLDEAVKQSARDASPGEVVLLSPACASWDQFTNFEERGDRFAALAREHADGAAKPPIAGWPDALQTGGFEPEQKTSEKTPNTS